MQKIFKKKDGQPGNELNMVNEREEEIKDNCDYTFDFSRWPGKLSRLSNLFVLRLMTNEQTLQEKVSFSEIRT